MCSHLLPFVECKALMRDSCVSFRRFSLSFLIPLLRFHFSSCLSHSLSGTVKTVNESVCCVCTRHTTSFRNVRSQCGSGCPHVFGCRCVYYISRSNLKHMWRGRRGGGGRQSVAVKKLKRPTKNEEEDEH